MPEQKKFDFATIAVIVISIGLTLGGFYLLNQSFAKNKGAEVAKSSMQVSLISSSSQESISKTVSSIISSSSESSTSQSSASSSELSSSFASSIASSSTSLVSSSSSSNSVKSNLSDKEAIFKVVESKDGKYSVEITDTGYQGGKYWKIGSKFRINSTLELKPNGQYKVFDINEKGDTVEFALIKQYDPATGSSTSIYNSSSSSSKAESN
jgi:hypothetical protein